MTDYTSNEFWMGAPDDATHFSPAHKAFVPLWAKCVDGVYLYKTMGSSGDWYYGAQPSQYEEYIERPAAQWTGLGLPPVGVECERMAGKVWIIKIGRAHV